MSVSASRDVARMIGDALDVLRRPGHDFGRDFMLKTGTDLPADLALLASPEVLRNANCAAIGFDHVLPPADDASPPLGVGRMQVAYALFPVLTGNLTCGLCVQTAQTPFVGKGRILYSAGRYVRCEATGELLAFLRPFGGVEDWNGRASVLVFARIDSPTSRFLVYANLRPGASMHQIYNDYERGDLGALAANFSFLQRDDQVVANGCPYCGLAAARDCNCELPHAVPQSSCDFSAVAKNHQHMFGSFRVAPLLYSLDAPREETGGGSAVSATPRCFVSFKFSKLRESPSIVTFAPLDGIVVSHLSTSCVQDYMMLCAVPRSSPSSQRTVHQGSHSCDREPFGSLSPVAKDARKQTVGNTLGLCSIQGVELEDANTSAVDTRAANHVVLDSVEHTGGRDNEYPVVDAAFNTTRSGMGEARFEAAREDVHDTIGTAEVTSLQPFLQEITHDPIEFACASPHPAKALHASSPHRPQPLNSRMAPSRDPSISLPRHIENASVAPQSGTAAGSPHSGNMLDSPQGEVLSCPPQSAQETVSGANQLERSVLETTAESLTREEKNRRSAARSNEKRRRALIAMKRDVANAQAEVRALMDREAEAKSLNRKLKEEAARRWMEAASTI